MDKFKVDIKKCYKHVASTLKGAMCSLCNPETSFRIVKNRIYFDRREAAIYVEECGDFIKGLVDYDIKFFQAVSSVMEYDSEGERNGNEK